MQRNRDAAGDHVIVVVVVVVDKGRFLHSSLTHIHRALRRVLFSFRFCATEKVTLSVYIRCTKHTYTHKEKGQLVDDVKLCVMFFCISFSINSIII